MNRPWMQDAVGGSELREFLERVRPRLRRLLMASNVPLADAEDLLQEALLVLLRQWGQLDHVANREAWLFGILRLTIAQYFRRMKRERRYQELLALELADSQAAPQEREDSARDLAALTADISPRAYQALYLRIGLELKSEEAAKSLGCRPDSVRKLSNRALARLRRRLSRDDRS